MEQLSDIRFPVVIPPAADDRVYRLDHLPWRLNDSPAGERDYSRVAALGETKRRQQAASSRCQPSAIVGITSGRGVHCRADRHPNAGQHPRALARRKARCQQPVIDLACDSKAIEGGWRKKETGVVGKAVRLGVDVALRSGDDIVRRPRFSTSKGGSVVAVAGGRGGRWSRLSGGGRA